MNCLGDFNRPLTLHPPLRPRRPRRRRHAVYSFYSTIFSLPRSPLPILRRSSFFLRKNIGASFASSTGHDAGRPDCTRVSRRNEKLQVQLTTR